MGTKSLIRSKCKYFHIIIQTAESRGQEFNFCLVPFAVNVMLKLSIINESRKHGMKLEK